MSDQSSENENQEQPDSRPNVSHTSLKCLALIGRHHGVDISVDRLIHDYSLEQSEPSVRRILRMASDHGFKVKPTRMSWKQLTRMGHAFPVMARLKNGNYVILVGIREVEDDDGTTKQELAVFDPLADRNDFLFLGRKEFQKNWNGDVILAKRRFSLFDAEQPFSLRWFIPEMARQWTAFVDVIVAAVFIYMLALVVPLFFQIVIDKVLVNNALNTLRVIGVGIVLALMFDAVLNYLRSYLLLHATSKIDVRVATRTFGHMLALPMTYFEHITAGVLTKHMQQSSRIREFLTGQLFMTLLDSAALIVFLPILFFYSLKLTLIVLLFSALLAGTIGILLGPYRRRLEALYVAEGDRQAMLVETIHGAQTVKALSMEPTQRKKWDDRSAQAVAMHYRVGKISITATTISKLFEKLMTVSIVYVGATLVFADEITVGAPGGVQYDFGSGLRSLGANGISDPFLSGNRTFGANVG